MNVIVILVSLVLSTFAKEIITIEHKCGDSLANSCVGPEDGELLLLSVDIASDHMLVRLLCSNEYVILDVNRDENVKSYFSSFEKLHYAVGGSRNDDSVNWEGLFLPQNVHVDSNSNGQYFILPDCMSCDTSHERQIVNDKTSYEMTGNLAKLVWGVIGFNECDFNADTYQCYDCSNCISTDQTVVCEAEAFSNTATDYHKAGVCGVAVQQSDLTVSTTRKGAQTGGTSIGTDGRFCICYQPSLDSVSEYTLTEAKTKKSKKGTKTNTNEIQSHLNSKSQLIRVDGHVITTSAVLSSPTNNTIGVPYCTSATTIDNDPHELNVIGCDFIAVLIAVTIAKTQGIENENNNEYDSGLVVWEQAQPQTTHPPPPAIDAPFDIHGIGSEIHEFNDIGCILDINNNGIVFEYDIHLVCLFFCFVIKPLFSF